MTWTQLSESCSTCQSLSVRCLVSQLKEQPASTSILYNYIGACRYSVSRSLLHLKRHGVRGMYFLYWATGGIKRLLGKAIHITRIAEKKNRNRWECRKALSCKGAITTICLSEQHSQYALASNLFFFHRFLPCDALRCTVFVIVILSVRLSVCVSVRLSHSWTVSTWFDLRS